MIELSFSTRLAAGADQVWDHATTMKGVNRELMPLVRMSSPRSARELNISEAPLGEVAFRSVLLAGSLIPIDLHSLRIVETGPGRRFLERSSSIMQRRWEHERLVEDPTGGPGADQPGAGSVVTDRLAIEPRIRLASPIVRIVVSRIFAHRHARLRRFFGEA